MVALKKPETDWFKVHEHVVATYEDEISHFLAQADKIKEAGERDGILVSLRTQKFDERDTKFAAIAWGGGSADECVYTRRLLISAIAGLPDVVESGNSPKLSKADYFIFKRVCETLGSGWLYFQAGLLRREKVNSELEIRRIKGANEILKLEISRLQVKLEQVVAELENMKNGK